MRPLRTGQPSSTAFIDLARQRALARKRPWNPEWAWVGLDRISPHLIHAVLLSEDGGFYRHHGIDVEALREALRRDLKVRRFAYGASTITQQLAKNLYLSPSKNPVRKLKELLITRRLEQELPKRRILELYLNVAQWGEGLYGAEAASRRYFGKPASDLSPEEAAALATALPNPRRLPPNKETRYLARTRRALLEKMRAAGYLPPETPAASSSTAPGAEEPWLPEPPPAEDAGDEPGP